MKNSSPEINFNTDPVQSEREQVLNEILREKTLKEAELLHLKSELAHETNSEKAVRLTSEIYLKEKAIQLHAERIKLLHPKEKRSSDEIAA